MRAVSEARASDGARECRVAVVVTREARVLLVRRAGRDGWRLPSGAPRPHESIETAGARLVREQTGLVVRLQPVADAISPPGADVVVLVYPAEELEGALLPGPECAEVSFWPLSELPSPWDAPLHRAALRGGPLGGDRPWRRAGPR